MTQFNNNTISIKKTTILILLIVALVLSWTGIGDNYADEMINDAIVDAGLLYGSARVVNALVSVIQSIDLSVWAISISPGEMLDPINDLVERFSSVMTVAIASLALQKILLYVLEHNVFNILLTLSGATVIFELIKTSRLAPYVFKVFFTLAILRISMSFIILANTSVDAAFLDQQEEGDIKNLTSLQSSLSEVANSLDGVNQSDEVSQLEREQLDLITQQQAITKDIKTIQSSIDALEEKRSNLLSDKAFADRLNPFEEDQEVDNIDQAISQHKEQITALNASEALLTESLDQIDEQIECAHTRAEGGTCSIGEWIGNKVGAIDIQGKIDKITTSVEGTIQSVLNLLMMAILKSILLPLLFWWILYKSIKWIWNRDTYPSSRIRHDSTLQIGSGT